MNFEAFTAQMAEEFPKAVRAAIAGESTAGRYIEPLLEICAKYHKMWGFDYPFAAWEDAENRRIVSCHSRCRDSGQRPCGGCTADAGQ